VQVSFSSLEVESCQSSYSELHPPVNIVNVATSHTLSKFAPANTYHKVEVSTHRNTTHRENYKESSPNDKKQVELTDSTVKKFF